MYNVEVEVEVEVEVKFSPLHDLSKITPYTIGNYDKRTDATTVHMIRR